MLREVVSERPEYVYSCPEYMVGTSGDDGVNLSCFYVHTDEAGAPVSAGCVVGVVLHRLGVPLEELRKHEGRTPVQMLKDVVSGPGRGVAHVLGDVQFEQDESTPWGEAYTHAMGETI